MHLEHTECLGKILLIAEEIGVEQSENENEPEENTNEAEVLRDKITGMINSETFIKDIEKAIIKNGSVRLVQAGEKRQELRTERDEQNQGYTSPETAKKWGLELGADFMLQGTINSIVDSYKKEQVVYYQVDLELTNLETNEVVWMGDKKIKKQVSDRAL